MTEYRLPLYARIAIYLIGFSLAIVILFFGRDVLIPLVFAALLSVLLGPLVGFLEKRRLPRLLSISIAITIACIVFAGLVTFIGMQVGQFEEGIPRLKRESFEYVDRLQAFLRENWGITYKDQLRWFQQWISQAGESGGFVSQTLLTFMDITMLIVLVPLYAFLMLLYKDLIVEFLFRLFPSKKAGTLKEVLQEARAVVKSYTLGLIIETAIVALLNSTALLLLGIDYAILFGIIAAILNLIPYIGILIGGLLPLVMAMITNDSMWYPIGVIGAFSLIQFIDNNFIVPYVVASRVSINALISIIAAIIGGMLWGISGMFLALPAVAILKVIFDRVETLKPWGFLLGDTVPDAAATVVNKRPSSSI